jgi:tetratricopeptide (TPR) repeat protein
MRPADHIEQGHELSLQAEYDRAIAAYTEALRQAPAEAVAWYGRGYCHLARGENDRALADFIEGIRLDPGPLSQYGPYVSQAYCARAEIHLERREFDRALADFTEGMRLRPESDGYRGYLWYRRGMCQLARGDYAAALADFDAALKMGYTGHQDCVVHARALAERLRQRGDGPPG